MRFFMLGFLLLTSTVPAFAQRGALTAHQNLQQLTDEAALIVRARVISAAVEPHPELSGLTTVVVRLQVRETLKGPARGSYTFRQYVWDIRDRTEGAVYGKGEELILFLNAPNQHGLSAPIGLEQGRFRIVRDQSGKEMALNGRGNHRLLEGLSAAVTQQLTPAQRQSVEEKSAGPIAVEELKALIRGAQEARQ